VRGGDRGDQRVGLRRLRLEQCGGFLGLLDRALPAINRVAGAKDVDAGGEPALDHRAADALIAAIAAAHSYTVPAIVAWDVIAAPADYVGWVTEATNQPTA
jgi:hypothetical protein